MNRRKQGAALLARADRYLEHAIAIRRAQTRETAMRQPVGRGIVGMRFDKGLGRMLGEPRLAETCSDGTRN